MKFRLPPRQVVLFALGSMLVMSAGSAFVVPATASTESGDPVIAAAGDIACDPAGGSFNGGLGTSARCNMLATATLISSHQPAADRVLALGDEQYVCGGYQAFLSSYDLSWGQFRSITNPAVGNHEYYTTGGTDCDATGQANGYFTYFGPSAGNPGEGYYDFYVQGVDPSTASWHVIILNGNCGKVGGCEANSPQGQFLSAALKATPPKACILAAWHQPRFSGNASNGKSYARFWEDLYSAHATIVLNGHAHYYERFVPQDPSGQPDTKGPTEFIVGSGGASHGTMRTIQPTDAFHDTTHYGVLFLTLHDGSYDWQFVATDGTVLDQSTESVACAK